jgi:putative transposase
MNGRGRCLDNTFIERRRRSLKQEAVYLHELRGGFQAKRVIKDWIAFYNSERPHPALDKRSKEWTNRRLAGCLSQKSQIR